MTDNGILIQDGDVATIEFNRRLAASPERVWAALTNADELAAWLTPGTIEGRIGGLVNLDFGEGGVITGEVAAFDPPALLTYTWVFSRRRGLTSDLRGVGRRRRDDAAAHPRAGAHRNRRGLHARLARLPRSLRSGGDG